MATPLATRSLPPDTLRYVAALRRLHGGLPLATPCLVTRLLAALLATLLPASAFGYSAQWTHRWITRQAVARLAAEHPGRYDELVAHVDDIALGAEEEDHLLLDGDDDPTTLRVLRHFFRPTDFAGLTFGGQAFPNSYDWAFVDGTNAWGWSRGLDAYRAGDRAFAYRVLGHSVHHIQDATVPAHSHLDPHGPTDDDDVEGYCTARCTSEFNCALPLPASSARLPSFATPFDVWVATASASYYRNSYPGTLSMVEGATGVIAEMFPSLDWSWFHETWQISAPPVGLLGAGFVEEAPGWFYFANLDHPAAVDKVEFDASGSGNDRYALNVAARPMVELLVADLVPIAVLHSAALLKLYADELATLPPLPDAPDAGPGAPLDGDDAAGCSVTTVAHPGTVPPSAACLLFALLLLLRRRPS